ncbi:hypothetical protein [Salinarimonas ramus]|uniref:Uncharacterized protein n=1 Tax=Salinarimonas ramus TaxID=690164 RepID=A0A917QID9_9HYPH|nr:hypothetical protein [Salinarimonas ramus]GGK51782.1 hypothetical protein GCM10011322_43530 [Salinarimonas ramus]
MVTSIYRVQSHACKTPDAPTSSLVAPRAPAAPGPVASPLLDADAQVAILAAVGDAGVIGLGDLVLAIPGHPRPISAVWALVSAGLLAADPGAPFDADLRIWRTAAA